MLLFVAAACIVSSDVDGINIFLYSVDTADTNIDKVFTYRNDSITIVTADTVKQSDNIRLINTYNIRR